MEFPECKLIETGGYVIDNRIDDIKEAILKKDGIVGADSVNDFRYFVGNCMNENMLNQIGGEIKTDRTKSFSLMDTFQRRNTD